MTYMKLHILLIISVLLTTLGSAQEFKGSITGKIMSSGKPVPFANIGIKGTKLGGVTDENGLFKIELINSGVYELQVSYIGFETKVQRVTVTDKHPHVTATINLNQISKILDEVVVTGTRNEKRRLDSAIPVNVLDSRVLQLTQSLNLSEGLSFQPGIRVEKDCQTCNYTQVRMNGLPGSYTQILINSRPLFSSLAGLYGLEQLPASMIERVEIVKGGGSVLYGSSAVAGTINIITKDPTSNSFELSSTGSTIQGESNDIQTDLYTSLIHPKRNSGLSLLVSHRDRQAWDANADGFSELAQFKNLSMGVNGFVNPDKDSKLRLSMNGIHEIRNGGDRLNKEPHLRQQSEYRDSKIAAGNVDYSRSFYRIRSSMELYAGAQLTSRDHYTGSFGSDGYGNSENQTFIGGGQFNYTLLNFISGKNILTAGLEYQYDYVFDEIKAYNYLVNQETFQTGAFIQSDWDLHPKINFVSGLRITSHNKTDHFIYSPRFSLLYKIHPRVQARISRSQGFRAPQAFDADMHIAFSGGGVALTTIDPNLKAEQSSSYNASLDYNAAFEKYIYGFTLNSFYTQLNNTFILVETPASGNDNNTQLTRTNGSDAEVKGITLEARLNYNYKLEGEIGVTWQKSSYEEAVAWSAEVPGSTSFIRTPEVYGYFAMGFSLLKNTKLSFSGVYTGEMDVPHFAGAPGVENDELVKTPEFMEINLKIDYQLPVWKNLIMTTVAGGVQNVTNAFQSDFDAGPSRDSNYIYGPGRPRTFFISIKLSSVAK